VSDDATWEALSIPYLITVRSYVGAALTIEAGSTVQFLEDASLNVRDEGSLTAVGTDSDPITFRSITGEDTAGFWKGISIETDSTDNQFDYVTIQYAGSDTWYGGDNATGAVRLSNGSLSITNSEIADITGWGIDVGNNSTLSACTNVTFTNITGDNIKDNTVVCN
jgi:hypothetical protein